MKRIVPFDFLREQLLFPHIFIEDSKLVVFMNTGMLSIRLISIPPRWRTWGLPSPSRLPRQTVVLAAGFSSSQLIPIYVCKQEKICAKEDVRQLFHKYVWTVFVVTCYKYCLPWAQWASFANFGSPIILPLKRQIWRPLVTKYNWSGSCICYTAVQYLCQLIYGQLKTTSRIKIF